MAVIPAGTREIQIQVAKGDWLTFSEVRISPYAGAPGGEVVIKPWDSEWGVRQQAFVLDAQGNLSAADGSYRFSKATLWTQRVEPWRQLAATGVGVHVGEWGAYRYTPHDVVLAWTKDCLDNWRFAGMGWALWNLRGDFGVLDSGRSDVAYEDYKGHKLDRKMLELVVQDGQPPQPGGKVYLPLVTRGASGG